MSNERRTHQPHDPLTKIGNAMLLTFAAQTKHLPAARAIVMLRDDNRGGLALSGYEGDEGAAQAAEDLIGHARAILRTIGMNLEVVHVPHGKGGVA